MFGGLLKPLVAVNVPHKDSPAPEKLLPLNSPSAASTVNFPGGLYDLAEHGGSAVAGPMLLWNVHEKLPNDDVPGTNDCAGWFSPQPVTNKAAVAAAIAAAKPFFICAPP